ncbi:hypothetical protein B0I35DRAFT_447098 [Stachybotrys elegans]|uniref:Uncharacterized protein n=1 Tax=Stachybotrys elegans TaxID=80388 RepID=A0A8K0SDA3_9HYPO|nr:hypothetical protein B0I35DRAFT_447098 [Stachybotrys elegans]
MGQIYRNALFTIVAAAATSANSGCFHDANVEPLTTRLPCPLGTLHLPKSCENHQTHSLKIFANVAPRINTNI